MGTFHAQYWFALEMINSAYPSVSLNLAGLCSFQVFLPDLLVGWGQEPCLLLNRIVTQLSCLGCRARQGSSISVSCLWIQIRQTCSMPVSLFYLTWFWRWLKPLVWITICALIVGTWSEGCCKSLSPPITTRFSVVKVHGFPAVLMGQNQSREPYKVTMVLGIWMAAIASLSRVEEPSAQRTPLCMILCQLRRGVM